jgi:hypothetical protein|tara:strand:+ start:1837 stop:2337 length:501 start_codon:yes stop_codon:yes gene_type:complete
MAEVNEVTFDAPIPGQSLTHEVGARPWQQPAQYPTVEGALDWYLSRFEQRETTEELLNVMEMGIPLTVIANSLQLGAVLEGVHSIDVGILVTPVLIEMMAYIAEQNGIEFKVGTEEEDSPKPSESLISAAIQGLEERGVVGDEEPMAEEEEEIEEEEPKGLMARRQ